MSLALCAAAALAMCRATPVFQASGTAAPTAQATPNATERNPAQLPRAQPQRWKDWTSRSETPEALREDLVEIVRAYREQKYLPALERCWLALEREPDFPAALYQLAVVYFRLRRYGDCQAVFERFLECVPHELPATQALGHCYYSLGDYARALEHYRKILEQDPAASIEVSRGLALSHVRLGRLEEGLALLEGVLLEKPDYADVHNWRSQVLYDLERSEEALQAAEKARQLEPFEPRGHFLAAQALRDLGRVEEAETAQARFLELNEVEQKVRTLEGRLLFDPNQRELLLRLVSLHQAVANKSGVREALARLLRLEPKSLETRLFALQALMRASAVEEAKDLAPTIERDFGQEVEAWRALRDFYGTIGDVVRQIQAGERYLRLGGKPDD